MLKSIENFGQNWCECSNGEIFWCNVHINLKYIYIYIYISDVENYEGCEAEVAQY